MISYAQAVILGAIQGLTELFPVSSLGHSIIIPPLLGWHIDQGSDFFLIFLVATHVATSLVLFVFFFGDWKRIIAGMWTSLKERNVAPENIDGKIGWLIVVATIPAGILGLLFEDKIQLLLAAPAIAAACLFLNGVLLLLAHILRKRNAQGMTSDQEQRHSDEEVSRLSWKQSVGIGFAQALALIPGFSRTGAALAGGLYSGLTYENSARFAFLLATPIIFAAAVLKLPELLGSGYSYDFGPLIAGVLAAGIAAYLSVRYLTSYFQTKTLKPFALYCMCAGIITFLIFVL